MKNFILKGFIRVEGGDVVAAVGLCYDLESGEIEEINSIKATQEDVLAINNVFQRLEEAPRQILFVRSAQAEGEER